MARRAVSLALAGLALCAPSAAFAQEPDAANGEATRISGAETTEYVITAADPGPPGGADAVGNIFRSFTSPFATSAVEAVVTCVAVEGNRAAIIGEVVQASGINATAVLIRIEDLAPEAPPAIPPPPPPFDRVSFAVDPREGTDITLSGCASFLGPEFPTQPITSGDFQVIDGMEPPPPPPPGCDDDDDDGGGDDLTAGGGDDGGDDDCDD